MKVMLPLIIGGLYFFLSILINIIKRNDLGPAFGRSIFSTIIATGIVFGIIIVFEKIIGIDFSSDRSFNDDHSDETGDNVDFTIGDEDEYSQDDDSSMGEHISADIVDDDEIGIDANDYSSIDDDEDASSGISVDSFGASVKDKLGIDASAEDMAKAVRTVLKRGGN